MALSIRRGSAAIQEAATKKSGGSFRPFMPTINWKADGEGKYVLVLTDVEDVATLLLHQFIPVGKGQKSNGEEFTRYEEFLSRRDPAIGESHDDLEDRLEREPKNRCLGVMVELDPITEGKKITGFRVKTEDFIRRTDDGEVEATAPVIGLCVQSAFTLWGSLDSTYRELGDLIDVPLRVTRRGKDQNTRYDILPYLEKPVDLSPVIDFMDGISYIGDDLAELTQAVEAAEGGVTKVQTIANFLLEKRINELADSERYEELVSPLQPEDMPKNPWGRKQQPNRSVRPRPQAATPPPAQEPTSRNERFAALKQRVEKG